MLNGMRDSLRRSPGGASGPATEPFGVPAADLVGELTLDAEESRTAAQRPSVSRTAAQWPDNPSTASQWPTTPPSGLPSRRSLRDQPSTPLTGALRRPTTPATGALRLDATPPTGALRLDATPPTGALNLDATPATGALCLDGAPSSRRALREQQATPRRTLQAAWLSRPEGRFTVAHLLKPPYNVAIIGAALVALIAVTLGTGILARDQVSPDAALVLEQQRAKSASPSPSDALAAKRGIDAASRGDARRTPSGAASPSASAPGSASASAAGPSSSTTTDPASVADPGLPGSVGNGTAGSTAGTVTTAPGPAQDSGPWPPATTPSQALAELIAASSSPNTPFPGTTPAAPSAPGTTPAGSQSTPATPTTPASTPRSTPPPAGGGSTTPVDPSTNGGGLKAVGFSAAEITEFSTAEIDRRVADMASMGAGWVRVDMNWRFVQAGGPGSFNWSNHDRAVQAIRNHGMNVLLVLDYAPGWAAAGNCSLTCPPRDPAEFATFAAAAARHFGPMGVRSWEIWNEPNLPAYWTPNPDPAAYTASLKAVYSAIHGVDGGATVLLGGQGITYTQGNKIGMKDFVSAVYANGGKNFFDAVAVHAHSYPAPPSLNQDWTGWTQMKQVRDVMVANGDSGKKIWITEYGAPTNGTAGLATQSNPNYSGSPDHVDENYQSALLSEAFATANDYSWAGPIFWYGYRDLGSSGSNENFFGVIRNDGSHKPAYDTFVAAASRTSKTSPFLGAAG